MSEVVILVEDKPGEVVVVSFVRGVLGEVVLGIVGSVQLVEVLVLLEDVVEQQQGVADLVQLFVMVMVGQLLEDVVEQQQGVADLVQLVVMVMVGQE